MTPQGGFTALGVAAMHEGQECDEGVVKSGVTRGQLAA